MTAPLFDLERLRRNWTLPAARETSTDRFAQVESALDKPLLARALLSNLREQCEQCFPEQREPLARYLERVERDMEQALSLELDPPALAEPARQALLDSLERLEELFEVFLRKPRR